MEGAVAERMALLKYQQPVETIKLRGLKQQQLDQKVVSQSGRARRHAFSKPPVRRSGTQIRAHATEVDEADERELQPLIPPGIDPSAMATTDGAGYSSLGSSEQRPRIFSRDAETAVPEAST